MSSLKVGDHVIAARRAEGSDVLTGVEHHATIISFTRPDRYGRRHVTVQYRKHVDKFPDIDTIKMQSGKGGNSTVLPAPLEESEVSLSSSQSSVSSLSSETSDDALVPATQPFCADAAAAADAEGSSNGTLWAPEYNQKVPANFHAFNALELLRIPVPDHVKARWQQVSPSYVVKDLFGSNAAANATLREVKLRNLQDFVGETEYASVVVKKVNQPDPTKTGLSELFASWSISGRCARARNKGLMFFYLMCRSPEQVEWPTFAPNQGPMKRRRCTPFSLAEMGRLTAIMADTKNITLVTMLLRKWTRADLDAKAGKKGVAYYWDELATIYNDKRYVPEECAEFQDHVRSCGTQATYATSLVPEYRAGHQLRTKWSVLRSNYALFNSRYNRSGHNESDPTKYTSDLHVLLMHYTFHDTTLETYAAKKIGDGAIDDAGDGRGAGAPTVKKRRKEVRFSFSADTVIAATTVYETLAGMKNDSMTDEEAEQHKVRLRRAAKLMDVCLDKLEAL